MEGAAVFLDTCDNPKVQGDKVSLKRISNNKDLTPTNEKTEEFSSPGGEEVGESSGMEQAFLKKSSVVKLARTFSFQQSVWRTLKEAVMSRKQCRGCRILFLSPLVSEGEVKKKIIALNVFSFFFSFLFVNAAYIRLLAC